MGLRYVKSLGKREWEKIEAARKQRPFVSPEDFVERTGLNEGSLMRLAEAGAFSSLESNRRSAIWRVRGETRVERSSLPVAACESQPGFESLDALETINWDYRTSRHSSRGHPLEPLREQLRARRLPDAHGVNTMRNGQRVRYAGIVICRPRPGPASGVLFITLEDESGFVNLVVWDRVFQDNAVLIKTTSFLGVTGKLQVQDGVTHVIAESFWIPKLNARPESGGSHDFH